MKRWRIAPGAWRAMCPRYRIVSGVMTAVVLIGAIALLPMWRHHSPRAPHAVTTSPVWTYGNARARYTLIEYADLECPYCKAYFPVLKRWIDAHPEVNWQWHHQPLAIHDPAAARDARWAECAGRVNGNAGFWRAVAWLYANTRSNGDGVPASIPFPETSSQWTVCLSQPNVDTAIEAQAHAADHEGITATPTVKLMDHSTGKSITIEGVVDGDALLSAIDLLATSSSTRLSSSLPTPLRPP